MADVAELRQQLAACAETVCRHYLPCGKRHGGYWLVGNIDNAPGSSLYVRLVASDKGEAGKWFDAATGEHGDLLDIIAHRIGATSFAETLEEARRLLSLPTNFVGDASSKGSSVAAAQRMFAAGIPIADTLAETYLHARGLTRLADLPILRFLARCRYRDANGCTQNWPALVAAVTDINGTITGIHRTWLARDGRTKAPLDPPRKALGKLNGHGVRFDAATTVLLAGEGLETVLSLREILNMPMIACLSASHLGALILPSSLKRLYIARDNDEAGRWAEARLKQWAEDRCMDVVTLVPSDDDFNTDLMRYGVEHLRAAIRVQLRAEDARSFLIDHD